jgi:conjugal transfer ATP-binding protein TraC
VLETLSKIGQKIANVSGLATPIDKVFSEEKVYEDTKNYFQKELPYRTWDEVTGIFCQDHSMGFVIEIETMIGCDSFLEKDLASLCATIGSEGDSIQCLLWADHRINPKLDTWSIPRDEQTGIHKNLADHKKLFFQKGIRDKGAPPPRDFRVFFSYSSQTATKEKLKEKKQRALQFFNRHTRAYDMTPQDFIDVVSGIVNYSQKTELQRRTWNPWLYLANDVCLHGSISLKNDHVQLKQGDQINHFKSFEVFDYPDEWTIHNNQALIGDFLNQENGIFEDFFIHYGIFFPKQSTYETKLKTKETSLRQQLKFKALRSMFSTAQKEFEEAQFALNEVKNGQKFVQTRMTVGLFSKKENLSAAEEKLKSNFSKLGFTLGENNSLHLDEFIRCLPMTWGESKKQTELKWLRAFKLTTTHEVGLMMPLLAEWKGNSHTGMPLLGRRGQFLTWSPFETDGNFNTVVVGPSGTGKSVFMQEVVINHLGEGGRVFVLDLGRSFEKLCKLLGGQHLAFNRTSNLNLNPFSLIPETQDTDAIEGALSMATSIICTMAVPTEKMDGDRSNMISLAVNKAFKRKSRRATVDDVIAALKEEEYETERMRGNVESLIACLHKYATDGEYRAFFYGKKTLEFQSDFVLIETEELKEMKDLQAVVMQIFSLMISVEVFMGDREKRSLICIDEAWDLLKSPQMEGFIEGMARRLRKYNGALLVATQDLKDFKNSPGAAAVFQNSNWLVILGKAEPMLPVIREQGFLKLTNHAQQSLTSMRMEKGKYSEAFIFNHGSGFYSLAQLKLDPFSLALFSTTAENFKKIQQLQEEGMTIEKAIEKVSKQGDLS